MQTSLTKTLTLFSGYIEGTITETELSHHMKFYKKHPIWLNRDFYLITIDSDDDVIEAIKQLLTKLNIPEEQWGRYFGSKLTIAEFLIELDKDRHIQTTYILKLIKKQRRYLWLLLLLIPLLLISVFIIVLAVIFVPSVFILVPLAIKSILASEYVFVLAGIGFTTLKSAYTFYENQFDYKKTRTDRWRDNAFLALNIVLTFTGYSIWLLSRGKLAIVCSLFLTITSVVDVAKELIYLKKEWNEKKQIVSDENDLNIKLANVRSYYNCKIYRNAAILNSLYALISLGTMIVSLVFPGYILISISLVSCVITAYVFKTILLKINEKYQRKCLQNDLSDTITQHQANAIEPQDMSVISPDISNEEIINNHPSLRFFPEVAVKTDDSTSNLCYGASFS